jgi:hypothetical protein
MSKSQQALHHLAAADPAARERASQAEQNAVLAAIYADGSAEQVGPAPHRSRAKTARLAAAVAVATAAALVIGMVARDQDAAHVGGMGLAEARAALSPGRDIVYLEVDEEYRAPRTGHLYFHYRMQEWNGPGVARQTSTDVSEQGPWGLYESRLTGSIVRTYYPRQHVTRVVAGRTQSLLDTFRAQLRAPDVRMTGVVTYRGRQVRRFTVRRLFATVTFFADSQSGTPVLIRVDGSSPSHKDQGQIITYRITAFRRLPYNPNLLRLDVPPGTRVIHER